VAQGEGPEFKTQYWKKKKAKLVRNVSDWGHSTGGREPA
jgi:hypothetical protein